jgi:hypothetical protein
VRPILFDIVDLKADICRNPRWLDRAVMINRSAGTSTRSGSHLRSVPMISAIGYLSAMSMHQIPVPAQPGQLRAPPARLRTSSDIENPVRRR